MVANIVSTELYISCNSVDLDVKQSLQGLSLHIFYKRSQPKYENILMIKMLHVHSNISLSMELGMLLIINFTNSWNFVIVKKKMSFRWLILLSFRWLVLLSFRWLIFFVFQMVNLIVFQMVNIFCLSNVQSYCLSYCL